MFIIIVIVIILIVCELLNSHSNRKELLERFQETRNTLAECQEDKNTLTSKITALQEKLRKSEADIVKLKEENELLDKAFIEGYEGSYLLKLVEEYRALRDGQNVRALVISRYPAPAAAAKVDAERKRTRQAEVERDKALLLAESCKQNSNETLKENNILLLAEQEDLKDDIQKLQDRNIVLQNEIERLRTSARDSEAVIQRQRKDNDSLRKQADSENSKRSEIAEGLFRKINEMAERQKILEHLLTDTANGAPYLIKLLDEYRALKDQQSVDSLTQRTRPAFTAAEKVKEETAKRRAAEMERDKALYLVEVYKELIPDADEIEESMNEPESLPIVPQGQDTVRAYLSKEEYSVLDETERNQRALDRFWARDKSKRLIGKLYEQYIGYLLEKEGYFVNYFGISKGLHDLGRDLICKGKDGVLIVQCKNWSKSKTIYEKHIFQLFGTLYQYQREHPFESASGVFYTSTHLSDLARDFAKEFHIQVHEDFELKPFPIIKCHVSKEGERIYHLPFDQQYDVTQIEPQDGDFYCMTVAEAEAKGFRRAYRWRGE